MLSFIHDLPFCGDQKKNPSDRGKHMLRLGLCCKFLQQPIKFKTTTATHVLKLQKEEALQKISRLCLSNAQALRKSLAFCADNHIGAFRVNSRILPLKTHPDVSYAIGDLPQSDEIIKAFKTCGTFARQHDLRLLFHPDQFILLNSPKSDVHERSIAELEYQAEVAQWIGADVIIIHGGGAYGNKTEALNRFRQNYRRLSQHVRSLLTLENDDRIYTPSDLLPVCRAERIPLVYDVHHHRCLPDGISVEETTRLALETWNREPVFHVSSPHEGWNGPKPGRHHDYIDPDDFPPLWRTLDITVEVEAKAKELAVIKLYRFLNPQKSDEQGHNEDHFILHKDSQR
jgi:UV DNA damage endonuclease